MKKLILFTTVLILCFPLMTISQENSDDKDLKPKNVKVEFVNQHPILSDRFIANAGVFIPTKTFKLRIEGSSDNELIDFTENFDLNRSETIFAGNFMWRFSKNKKWSVSLEYFGVKSNHSIVLEDEIEWEDVTYPVGVNIDTGFRINMYRIFFGRSIIRKQNHEMGAGLGAHVMDIRTFIEGDAYLGDNITPTVERKSVDVMAPVPNIGFWYFYTPNEKWALTARVDWLQFRLMNIVGPFGIWHQE